MSFGKKGKVSFTIYEVENNEHNDCQGDPTGLSAVRYLLSSALELDNNTIELGCSSFTLTDSQRPTLRRLAPQDYWHISLLVHGMVDSINDGLDQIGKYEPSCDCKSATKPTIKLAGKKRQ